MKLKLALAVVVGAFVSGMLSGCDLKPSAPKNASGQRVDVVAISPADSEEFEAVKELEKARVNYAYRLAVLRTYYKNIGNADKYDWAGKELANLANVKTFRWEGLPNITAPAGESLAGADERRLAEQAVGARNAFCRAEDDLIALYASSGQSFKAGLIRNMKSRLDPIRTYMYFLEAELPPANLRPASHVPAAEELYGRAHKLYRRGKMVPLLINYDKERQALLLFQELIRKYPQSTKIALSAYHVAEIYKEYFGENYRAVQWYERAWQWDPNIAEPARFQAAVVWDYRLHHREKALLLYRQVLAHEQFNQSNVSFARQRIGELIRPVAR